MSYGRMSKQGGFWKRPVSRTYHYNFQVGENYYHPMTSYLDSKYTMSMPSLSAAAVEKEMAEMERQKNIMMGKLEPPGALGFR